MNARNRTIRVTGAFLTSLLIASAPLGWAGEGPGTNDLAATGSPGLLDDLLALAGIEKGRLGLDDAFLDRLQAAPGAAEAKGPSDAVAFGRGLLDRLNAADSPSEAYAAAAFSAAPQPKAATSGTLTEEVLALYGHMGRIATPQQVQSIDAQASSMDPELGAAVARLVAAVNAAHEALGGSNADLASSAAGILAAAEGLTPSTQASSSAMGCPTTPIFQDPDGIISIRGTCSDNYTAHHAIQIDLGGDDFYFNNAGGSTSSNTPQLVPTIGLPPNPGPAIRDALLALNPAGALQNVTTFVASCLAGGCSVTPGTGIASAIPVAVSLDLGAGSDTYSTGVSPAQGASNMGIGILIDQGGSDDYTAASRAQGWAAGGGIGILVDGGGSDDYHAIDNAQGSNENGFLIDLGFGNDNYTAGHSSQGGRTSPLGAAVSHSLLFDAGGNDVYDLDGNGQGGGNFLVDSSGDDVYDSVGSHVSIATNGRSQGAGILNAPGFLIDGLGDDHYTSDILFSQGVAGGVAAGALLDFQGDDHYVATELAQGFCFSINGEPGVLYDGGGNDEYATAEGQGSSSGPCGGFLVDVTGDDTYDASVGSQGTAVIRAGTLLGITLLGALVDADGNDAYTSGGFSQGSGALQGAGLLLDADGSDHYEAGDSSQGSGSDLGFGILVDGLQDAVGFESDLDVDLDGNGVSVSGGLVTVTPGDQPPAGPAKADGMEAGNLSQGSGSSEGVGVLVDNDDETTANGPPHRALYQAGDSSQGSGIDGGFGVLVNREGRDDYTAGITSQGSATGTGLGALLDQSGRDSYTVTDSLVSRGYAEGAVGLLLDTQDNNDVYSDWAGFSHNNVCEAKGELGLTVDINLPNIPDCLGALMAAVGAVVGIVTELVLPPPGAADPCAAAGTYFCDDMEAATSGWVVDNVGLNQWRIVNQTQQVQPNGQNANSGFQYWYVGAPGASGVTYLPGDGPLGSVGPASSITSPAFGIPSGAVNPTLTVALSGGSEECFDQVEFAAFSENQPLQAIGPTQTCDPAVPQGTVSGTRTYTTPFVANMNAFIGDTAVHVVIRFTSDDLVQAGPGWNVDDVVVA